MRIWVYWNDGIARINVTEEKPVLLISGGPTDEGYSYHEERFTLEGNVITREVCDSSRDCDGRHEWHSTLVWSPEMGFVPCNQWNDAGEMTELAEQRPNWSELKDSWQRDYQAEAAGY